jgi:hypothetical protein
MGQPPQHGAHQGHCEQLHGLTNVATTAP